jgi:hypothetical protein
MNAIKLYLKHEGYKLQNNDTKPDNAESHALFFISAKGDAIATFNQDDNHQTTVVLNTVIR